MQWYLDWLDGMERDLVAGRILEGWGAELQDGCQVGVKLDTGSSSHCAQDEHSHLKAPAVTTRNWNEEEEQNMERHWPLSEQFPRCWCMSGRIGRALANGSQADHAWPQWPQAEPGPCAPYFCNRRKPLSWIHVMRWYVLYTEVKLSLEVVIWGVSLPQKP